MKILNNIKTKELLVTYQKIVDKTTIISKQIQRNNHLCK